MTREASVRLPPTIPTEVLHDSDRARGCQQAGKIYRIGVLTPVSLAALEAAAPPYLLKAQARWSADNPGRCGPNPNMRQYVFCRVGYVKGQNIAIEARWGAPDQLPAAATELVRLKVDVVHAIGPVAIRAAKQATATIPIVMMTSGDPVALGFVQSLARPGGTGGAASMAGTSELERSATGLLLLLDREGR
jgi:putative ABC transport system substrate-binding protein